MENERRGGGGGRRDEHKGANCNEYFSMKNKVYA
jgi:hypothetical protein